MVKVFVAAVVVLAFVPWAAAEEPGAQQLAQAEQLAKDGRSVEAAAAYGKELAAARKKKDLEWQERVARSLCDTLKVRSANGSGGQETQAQCLASLMGSLDPKANAAFYSAGRVAHALLMDATRTGAYGQVAAASPVCASHAKQKGAGAYAKAMADYATGLEHVAAGAFAAADGPLAAALDVVAKEEWVLPTLHVATELAAARVADGNESGAAAALEKAGRVLGDNAYYPFATAWRTLVKARLEGASETVLAPYEAAMEPHSGGGSVSAAGGAGAPGGAGGSAGQAARQESKVGRAWKKLSKRKPFVLVTRTADGYVVRQGFDKAFEAVQPATHGVKHHADGGITLSFWDGGVRLHMVDMRGLDGQPGESSQPDALELFVPLARGETWGVSKTGVVSVTSK